MSNETTTNLDAAFAAVLLETSASEWMSERQRLWVAFHAGAKFVMASLPIPELTAIAAADKAIREAL